jgi:hypothetical protein
VHRICPCCGYGLVEEHEETLVEIRLDKLDDVEFVESADAFVFGEHYVDDFEPPVEAHTVLPREGHDFAHGGGKFFVVHYRFVVSEVDAAEGFSKHEGCDGGFDVRDVCVFLKVSMNSFSSAMGLVTSNVPRRMSSPASDVPSAPMTSLSLPQAKGV